MTTNRISEAELQAAIRAHGIPDNDPLTQKEYDAVRGIAGARSVIVLVAEVRRLRDIISWASIVHKSWVSKGFSPWWKSRCLVCGTTSDGEHDADCSGPALEAEAKAIAEERTGSPPGRH